MQATHLRDISDTIKGTAHLWRLDPPHDGHDIIVTSAVVTPSGPEIYAFGSDMTGDISSWLELSMSQRGILDHERILVDAGYAVDWGA